jgi:hypothetical protein
LATIVILEHELQRYVKLPYMVYGLAERWSAQGHRVLKHHGLGTPPEADVAVANVDLTVVPEAYSRLHAGYAKVVNGRVTDVSKRRFSQHLLDRYSDWIGPVIVKTDANFGGKPEWLMRTTAQREGLDCDIPQGPVAEGYPTYASLRDVPEAVWRTPGLVAERFLPEVEDGDYFLRTWFFLGTRERSSRWRAKVPIIKASDYVSREDAEVPAEIREWRARLGLDFGKFDYVRNGDRFLLLDVNPTPGFPDHGRGMAAVVLDHLAEGLLEYLD